MTDEARRALEAAVTEEDVIAVAEKFKLTMRALSDEELDRVAGGHGLVNTDNVNTTIEGRCYPDCHKKHNGCWC